MRRGKAGGNSSKIGCLTRITGRSRDDFLSPSLFYRLQRSKGNRDRDSVDLRPRRRQPDRSGNRDVSLVRDRRGPRRRSICRVSRLSYVTKSSHGSQPAQPKSRVSRPRTTVPTDFCSLVSVKSRQPTRPIPTSASPLLPL